ncbi:Lysine-specific demethylase 8 [Hondaea fermentalgiana]|uniref:Lysine-specific demethylase 8 n=1 Tax=Hondaea fermentalgiana TaxID=2315210 RepID=A0A2R5FYV0_9STRA|nr:Lysine-specific demethylase 8 [Hondaea fermentalgiana]|eukprot:GBG23932.1 Lysine-specific demethylase 8 [Hondaea fermentalgiana]
MLVREVDDARALPAALSEALSFERDAEDPAQQLADLARVRNAELDEEGYEPQNGSEAEDDEDGEEKRDGTPANLEAASRRARATAAVPIDRTSNSVPRAASFAVATTSSQAPNIVALEQSPYYELEFQVPHETWTRLIHAVELLRSGHDENALAGAEILHKLLDDSNANGAYFDVIVQRSISWLRNIGPLADRSADDRVRSCIARIENIAGAILEDLLGDDEERRNIWIHDHWDGRTPHREHLKYLQRVRTNVDDLKKWRLILALGIAMVLLVSMISSFTAFVFGIVFLNMAPTNAASSCYAVSYFRVIVAVWVATSTPALATALNFVSFHERDWTVANPVNRGPLVRVSLIVFLNLLASGEFILKLYEASARVSSGAHAVLCDEELLINGPYLLFLYLFNVAVSLSLLLKWVPPDLQVKQPCVVRVCWVPSFARWHAAGLWTFRCFKPLFSDLEAMRDYARQTSAEVVLQADEVREQRALTCAWTLKDVLASRKKEEKVPVKCSKNRWFMYNETGNADLLADAGDHVQDLRWEDVLDGVETSTNGEYVYYTGPVPGPAGTASAAWISSAKSGTRAHYDAFDNQFFQLKGQKRIRVHAPTEHFAFHVFPDAHSRARKSQVDSDQPDLQSFPLFAELAAPALDVILEPGDSISIPAFWFHEVESLTSSVSVNAFSMSPVASVAGRVFARPLPLDAAFIRDTIAECTSWDGPTFVSRLLQSRYEPLYGPVDALALDDGPKATEVDKIATTAAFQTLRAACGAETIEDAPNPDTAGVTEIVMAHLLELSCVRASGPNNVQRTLQGILDRI